MMAVVKKSCMFQYGKYNKAHIALNVRQKWRVVREPATHLPWYTLSRGGVVIDVLPEDFERFFEVEDENHL